MSNIQLVVSTNRLLESAFVKKHPKNWIKELREERGWTLEGLAGRVGVTNPHISMLEQGKRGLSWPMVRKLADALGCEPSDITDGPGKDKQERALIGLYKGMSDSARQQLFEYTEFLSEKDQTMKKNQNDK